MNPAVVTLPPGNRRADEIGRVVKAVLGFAPDRPVNVKVSIARPERTPPQCRYLNGVAYALLADHTGFDRDEISEYLCGNYFGWRDKPLPGGRFEQVPIRTTTTDEHGNRDVLEGKPFWDYVAWIQRVGARHGVHIPDPDPDYKLKREAK